MVVARGGLYRSKSNIIKFIVKQFQRSCHSSPEVSEGEESLERMI